MFEALRYIAIQADMKLVVEPYAICPVPPETNMDVTGTTQDRLLVAEFQMPLEVVGRMPVLPPVDPVDKSTPIARLDPKPWLMQQGIPFPEGATAAYVFPAQRLVVRNTKGNLDRIEALLQPATPPKGLEDKSSK